MFNACCWRTHSLTTSCELRWKCTFPAGYCTGTSCATTTELCDTKDNNCNGQADETFKPPFLVTGFLGQTCSTPVSDGPCQGEGEQDRGPSRSHCSEVCGHAA